MAIIEIIKFPANVILNELSINKIALLKLRNVSKS